MNSDESIYTEDGRNSPSSQESSRFRSPRILQVPENVKPLRFLNVLGDNIIALVAFTITSGFLIAIAISNTNVQKNRDLVSFIYSIGGDLGLHWLVTSITSIVLSIRVRRGIRLDSLCDYLSILAGPKAQFSISKWSRFWSMFALILMNHLAEQAVNYGVPSQPDLKPLQYKNVPITLAPLGGGTLLQGNVSVPDGKPVFKFFKTGLSILATDPDTDNSAFYSQDGQDRTRLRIYHLPQELFDNEQNYLITREFPTLGYVGMIKREEPTQLRRCSTTSSSSISLNDCDGPMPPKGVRFSFEVNNKSSNNPTRTDIEYRVSLLNSNQEIFSSNWTYSITLTRTLVWAKCKKQMRQISCETRNSNEIIAGSDWLNTTAHEDDLEKKMGSCFVNLLSFNRRSKQIEENDMVGRVIAAMHIRHSADDTFTGGLATSQLPERFLNAQYEISESILTYRGPIWLRSLLLTISILASFSLIGNLFVTNSIPSSLISIIGSLGMVVNEHRLPAVSELERATKGLYEEYETKLKVYAGLATGTDHILSNGHSIKLVRNAGPGSTDNPPNSRYGPHVARYSISTLDKVVKQSNIITDEAKMIISG